jgi:hypothetical protein
MGIVFPTVLSTIAIPYVSILILENSFLGEQGAWLAVIVATTITNLISIIANIIKVIPKMIFLRIRKILMITLDSLIRIMVTAGFILYYSHKF